ncbi:CheR family methyltransferase [Paraglaciecola marina]|uniref:CheR family methyltransferase n=1 Tax=Paraglaciecola marina TaxID=2500157 RepID=UPI001060DA06|nr:protein-glutamate O-methyltransferase CheR [Paraglaciecola marina]
MMEKDLDIKRYSSFSQFLEQACGIVLGNNRQYLVRSRLTPIVRQLQLDSIEDCVDKILAGDSRVRELAVEAMTTNETLWFRDQYPFVLLEKDILQQFATKPSPLRIWSAACSSGQEAYSIAMTILNFKKLGSGLRYGAEIIGTDISDEMLQRAKLAEYDYLAMSRGIEEKFKTEYFEPVGSDKLRVKSNVRALTQFKPLNLLGSYQSLGRFDIIFCRNVLIYFSPEVKKKILQKFAACLQEGGILFLGASESISNLTDEFTMVRCQSGLYYRKNPS